jgi:hypothetical protein
MAQPIILKVPHPGRFCLGGDFRLTSQTPLPCLEYVAFALWGLKRYQRAGDVYFVTFSCYCRQPLGYAPWFCG